MTFKKHRRLKNFGREIRPNRSFELYCTEKLYNRLLNGLNKQKNTLSIRNFRTLDSQLFFTNSFAIFDLLYFNSFRNSIFFSRTWRQTSVIDDLIFRTYAMTHFPDFSSPSSPVFLTKSKSMSLQTLASFPSPSPSILYYFIQI